MIAIAYAAAALAALTATAPLTVTKTAAGSSAPVVASADSVARVLRDKGYQAEITTDSSGDPLIRSSASGAKFMILFYGCEKGRDCTSIQFYAGFKSDGKMKVEKMNEWNRDHRFSRAYLDSVNDPCVEWDVNLDEGGVSPALFADDLENWSSVLGSFRDAIN